MPDDRMTQAAVKKRLKALPWVDFVTWDAGQRATVTLRGDFTISLTELRELADLFGTTDIAVSRTEGFGGSDVTPAESDTLELVIKGHQVKP